MNPYDQLNDVLNTVRTRMNDALPNRFPTNGRVLENTQQFMQQCTNQAWRKFQKELSNKGYTKLKQTWTVTGLPVVFGTDPATEVYINWFNYSDGSNLFTAPVLPDDMLYPLRISERVTGQNCRFAPMTLFVDGLPSLTKVPYNRIWEWRNDSIYMPGSQSIMDLQIVGVRREPDFESTGDLRWFEQRVPIIDSLDAFAWWICSEIVRDDMVTQALFEEKAVTATGRIFNADVKMKQRGNIRRQPRSGRGQHGAYGYV